VVNSTTALKVENLNVYYGDSQVIRDVSFDLANNETVAIMGRNGMGKTTLLKALIGLLPARSGLIELGGQVITDAQSHERVIAGLGYVPQGRMIFPYLTVQENILTGIHGSKNNTVPSFVYDVFPVLKEMRSRRGGNLSGGQQQQLAIARALVSNPKVLVLDEPTEGIQPSIIKDIARSLNRLKAELNFALVVSEQMLSFTMEIADRFLIIEKGEIVYQDGGDEVDTGKIHAYLTI
jgi:urea transport system ATP-binding protein|tara:strand:- start:26103 stop:26810 length:708 start_codon:yes stop_codon:yes gene_type:complete